MVWRGGILKNSMVRNLENRIGYNRKEQLEELKKSIERLNVIIANITEELQKNVFNVYIYDSVTVTGLERLNQSLETALKTKSLLQLQLNTFKRAEGWGKW